jgi:hypothetical protein
MGRRVYLLLAGYDASNGQFRQDVRVPTSVPLAFHPQEACTHQTGRTKKSLLVFFLTGTTLVLFSSVLTTRDSAKVSL